MLAVDHGARSTQAVPEAHETGANSPADEAVGKVKRRQNTSMTNNAMALRMFSLHL
jgi:hypothetical protein